MTHSNSKKSRSSSVDPNEIERFSIHAEDWWNPQGAMRALHQLNPVRLRYIRDAVIAHTNAKPETSRPLQDLNVLDVGCGAGLLCEPMARLGGRVDGIDAATNAIRTARAHASRAGLRVTYVDTTIEELATKKKRYDVVTALEILEHVADLKSFLECVATVLKPGGLLILSTINRTVKSYWLGIVAAEYVLRWVPKGTHDWHRFLKPSEIATELADHGIKPCNVSGVVYDPFGKIFELSPRRIAVNFMMTAVKTDRP